MTLFILPLALAACVGSQSHLTLEQQLNLIEKDLSGVFSSPAIQKPLSMSEAMARGVKHNLDRKLAEQEQSISEGEADLSALNILPELQASGSALGRNSPGASSSRSIQTGQTSLEPSISSEQYRHTATLEASWNVLDAGMNYVRMKQTSDKALIARERQRKVVHNIMQDIRYAFWRAVGAELIESRAYILQKRAQDTVRYLQTAEALNLEDSSMILQKQSKILESIHEMNRLKSELSFAKTELAALINLPASTDYSLKVEPYSDVAFLELPSFTLGAEELESMALVMRPEMREEAYKQRIQQNALHLAVMETFPGLELFTGANYDSNKFLEDRRWVNFSVSLTQNLMKLFTLPARYEQEKDKQRAGDLRRQALAAAVMTQTRIAMTRYYLAKDQFNLMKRIHDVDQRMAQKAEGQAYAETISEPDLVLAEIRELLSLIRTYLAYADLQNAYGRVINTTGLDPLPEGAQSANLYELEKSIAHRLANQDRILEDVYWAIYNKSGGAIAPRVQPAADYSSLDDYTSSVYGGGAKTRAQEIDYDAPYKPPSKDPAINRYKGPSQPILYGDPAAAPQKSKQPQQEVKVINEQIRPASYVATAQSCDTYYEIMNGCAN